MTGLAQETEVRRHDGSCLQKHDPHIFWQWSGRLWCAPDDLRKDVLSQAIFGDGPSLREGAYESQCDRLDAMCLKLIVNRTHALKAELEDIWRHHNVVVCETFRA